MVEVYSQCNRLKRCD